MRQCSNGPGGKRLGSAALSAASSRHWSTAAANAYNRSGLKAKVADFGGSKIVGDEEDADKEAAAVQQEREMTSNVGTPVYMVSGCDMW